MYIDLTVTGLTDMRSGHIIRDTIDHALNTLMPRRKLPIYIEVEVAKDEDMGMASGLVHQEDDDTFFMSLSESVLKDYEELVYTVAHESVHIKQYLRKEVRDISVNEKIWMKDKYDLREVNYSDLPWEQEAHFLQMPLANKVLKTHGICG